MELTVEYLRQRHFYWIEKLADAGIWEADKFKHLELIVRKRCKSYVGLFHRKWVKVKVRRRLRDRIIIYRKQGCANGFIPSFSSPVVFFSSRVRDSSEAINAFISSIFTIPIGLNPDILILFAKLQIISD